MKVCDLPDNLLYHFSVRDQSFEDLFRSLYRQQNEETKKHFKLLNPHLEPQVKPGQMVIISPPNTPHCKPFEDDLRDAAERIDRQLANKPQTPDEATVMSERYGLLANIANYSSATYGVVMNYFSHHKSGIEHTLNEIEKLYLKMYKQYGHFDTAEFFKQRRLLFSQLETTLNRMIGEASMGLHINAKNIKNSLGLSTKSILHQLKNHPNPIANLPNFEKTHLMVRNYAKTLKIGGGIALLLDGTQSVAKIKEACSLVEKNCGKTKFGEAGRLSGSIVGGAFGGKLAAAAICNAVFGLPSGGTSLLWCNIVAGSVGGYLGGNTLGKFAQDQGMILYDTRKNGLRQ